MLRLSEGGACLLLRELVDTLLGLENGLEHSARQDGLPAAQGFAARAQRRVGRVGHVKRTHTVQEAICDPAAAAGGSE